MSGSFLETVIAEEQQHASRPRPSSSSSSSSSPSSSQVFSEKRKEQAPRLVGRGVEAQRERARQSLSSLYLSDKRTVLNREFTKKTYFDCVIDEMSFDENLIQREESRSRVVSDDREEGSCVDREEGGVDQGVSVTLTRASSKRYEVLELLETQSISSGLHLMNTIVSYEMAKKRLNNCWQRMVQGDSTAATEFNEWDEYIKRNPEFRFQRGEEKRYWAASHALLNCLCLHHVKSVVPPDVCTASLESLAESMNAEVGSHVWNRKALWLIHMTPEEILEISVDDMQTTFSVRGLHELELRAIWSSFPDTNDHKKNDMISIWSDAIFKKILKKSNFVTWNGPQTFNPASRLCHDDATMHTEMRKNCEDYFRVIALQVPYITLHRQRKSSSDASTKQLIVGDDNSDVHHSDTL